MMMLEPVLQDRGHWQARHIFLDTDRIRGCTLGSNNFIAQLTIFWKHSCFPGIVFPRQHFLENTFIESLALQSSFWNTSKLAFPDNVATAFLSQLLPVWSMAMHL